MYKRQDTPTKYTHRHRQPERERKERGRGEKRKKLRECERRGTDKQTQERHEETFHSTGIALNGMPMSCKAEGVG